MFRKSFIWIVAIAVIALVIAQAPTKQKEAPAEVVQPTPVPTLTTQGCASLVDSLWKGEWVLTGHGDPTTVHLSRKGEVYVMDFKDQYYKIHTEPFLDTTDGDCQLVGIVVEFNHNDAALEAIRLQPDGQGGFDGYFHPAEQMLFQPTIKLERAP